MATDDTAVREGSLVRNTLIALGAIILGLTGQIRGALVLGAAIWGTDALARKRQEVRDHWDQYAPEVEGASPVKRPSSDARVNGAVSRRATGPARSSTPAVPRSRPAEPEPARAASTPGHDADARTERAGRASASRQAGSQAPSRQAPSRGSRSPNESAGGGLVGSVKREVSEAQGEAKSFANQHPIIKDLWRKYTKDNVGMLAAFVSWGVLTSIVPILVGLVAISGFVLQAAHVKAEVVSHLADATQGAFTAKDIQSLVNVSTNHAGLLGIIGFVGILWGGSNVGGSISTAFQAIFEVSGRSFIKEKLIDIAMIFVFAVMMVLIILGTSAGTIVTQLFSSFPLPGLATVVGLAISLIAAFLLFATIYLVFPNIEPPFKFSAVWRGAAVAAVLFTILSLVWPLYASHAHFGRYGTLLTPILILTAWIYFFSMILMIGAEVVAVLAIREAQSKGESIGPAPQESVPQHEVLRDRGGAQAAQ